MSFLEYAWSILPQLLEATQLTLLITAGAIALGFVAGVVLALSRVYGPPPVRGIAAGYIAFFRGTPLLVQITIVYFGLPQLVQAVGLPNPSRLLSAIVGFGLNSAAYQAEYFRGAVQSIQSGQMMAARALGLSRLEAIRHVILPQALRLVIPSWSNELIYTIKYSSLAYFLTLPELMFVGKKLALKTANTFQTYMVVAAIYLIIVMIVSWFLHRLEKRVRIPGLGAPAEHR